MFVFTGCFMHTSISGYLSALTDKGRSPLTVKAARGDLLGFAAWWESRFSRPFDPALRRTSDLQTWSLIDRSRVIVSRDSAATCNQPHAVTPRTRSRSDP